MNKEQTTFLLKYAKIGVLASKGASDEIEFEELKQGYHNIKKELTKPEEVSKEDNPTKKDEDKPGEKKESAVKKWFKGIGTRQRKYQEEHKGDPMQ